MEKLQTIHSCTKCNGLTAKVNWNSDSDGASYTWITWAHQCQNPLCNFYEEKELKHMLDQEDIGTCGICGGEYIY